MKITFNDASEMTIQSATIRTDGSLLIKTISATEDDNRNVKRNDRSRVRRLHKPECAGEIYRWDSWRSDVSGKRITNGSY